jgi:ABC-2 type transport system ATP-binding protein
VFETPWSILLNQAGYYGISRKQAAERATHYLQAMDLWEKRHQIARFLSGGMKRRLMIARALVHEPSILILDEPTAGVDVHIRQAIWSFLKDLNAAGKTIILTTHYFEEAEQLCRHVAWLHKGCVLEQAPMSDLLAALPLERFYLHLDHPQTALPDLPEYQLSLETPTCLLVALQQGQDVTALLIALANQGVLVRRIVNEKNRLEALFITRLAALKGEQM